MKLKQLFSAGLAGTVALLVQNTSAQTWQTVDDFQYASGVPVGGQNTGLTVAPSGIIYACGTGEDATTNAHALVMASADDGNTWSAPLDDFVYPGSTGLSNLGIIHDAAGILYVAGRYNPTNGGTYEYVRRSADAGATWQTVDTVPTTPGISQPLAADATGNIYLAEDYPLVRWAVGKGIGGTNYSTVDTPFTSLSQANAVFAHPTAGVFAAGYAYGSNGRQWIVRRSLNGGATWATVDTYQASSGYLAMAMGLGADANGNIYAVGWADVASTVKKTVTVTAHWQVRKSTNGGTSWNTVDDCVNGGWPRAVGTDSHGNVFVAGSGGSNWIVRESLGGTGVWTTVDNFPYVNGAGPFALAPDALGNIFVGGWGNTSPSGTTVNDHWLVRKN